MAAAWARDLTDVEQAIPADFYGDAVRWVQLPKRPLRHRFVECGFPRGMEWRTIVYSDRALLRKAAAAQRGRDVTAGVIAHISRCGSTMLAVCMSQADDVVVLSEPPIVSALLESDDRRDPTLRSVLALYAQRFGASRVVVKLQSRETALLGRFRRRSGYPPAVVLFRNPVEVAVSNLQRPTLLDVKRFPEVAARKFGGSAAAIRRMSREQFCAWILTRYLRRLVAAPVSKETAMIDYARLDLDTICRLTESFLGPLLPAERSRIGRALRFHSKRPAERYRPDSWIKRRAAPPRLSAMLREATRLYGMLAARQRLPEPHGF